MRASVAEAESVEKRENPMIRRGTDEDFEEIFNIINDAAMAYKGVIPLDRWHEPYMTRAELQTQIEDGVRFSCYVDDNEIIGVWNQATAPESRSVLLLVMDLSRRAWKGSKRAKAFYEEQQRLWVELLVKFLPDQAAVEEVLQLFQGALLTYLITGDRDSGRRVLLR